MFSIFETIYNLIAGRLFLNKIGGFIKKTVLVLAGVIAVLFVVYFWNLDQKLLGWAYKQVNLIFDRKKVDQVF